MHKVLGRLFKVVAFPYTAHDDCLPTSTYFATEREAREYINAHADGGRLYRLFHDGELIVESRYPVLMVA